MKELSSANWLQLDEQLKAVERLGTTSVDPSELAEDFLKIKISKAVPQRFAHAFARARGALVYGSLFYPLYSLGVAELARLALAARVEAAGSSLVEGAPAGAEGAFWQQVSTMVDGDFVAEHGLGPDEIHDVAKRLAHALSALFDPDIDLLTAWTRRR